MIMFTLSTPLLFLHSSIFPPLFTHLFSLPSSSSPPLPLSSSLTSLFFLHFLLFLLPPLASPNLLSAWLQCSQLGTCCQSWLPRGGTTMLTSIIPYRGTIEVSADIEWHCSAAVAVTVWTLGGTFSWSLHFLYLLSLPLFLSPFKEKLFAANKTNKQTNKIFM